MTSREDSSVDAEHDPGLAASPIDPALREAVLHELAGAPEGISLPRLCKRLRVRMSVLLRALAWLGDEPIGTQRGEGLVRVEQHGDSQIATLIAASDNAPTPPA